MKALARISVYALGFVSLWLAGASPARAKSTLTEELPYRSSLETSPDPLSTEDFATFDPGVVNPHLQRWALSRIVKILGLAPRKLHARAGDTYGVSISALDTQSTVHLRPAGPWYQSLSQFPCRERTPTPTFATMEGTQTVAENAARLWDEVLIERKKQLVQGIARISLTTPSLALEAGQRVFKEWLGGVDAQWRARVSSELVAAQWQADRKQAMAGGVCRNSKVAGKTSSEISREISREIWPDTWLPDASAVQAPPKAGEMIQPVFRAPAKRIEGYFTVRLDLRVGYRNVSGQFLIDPTSPTSVVSPDWLLAQGVAPIWVEIPEAPPSSVRVHAGSGANGLAKVAFFDQVTASGYTLAIQRFQVHDVSEIFDDPEVSIPCCSGVLGQDFLSRYVLEFQPTQPMEVIAWPVRGYTPSRIESPAATADGWNWVELRHVSNSEFKTECSPRVQALGVPKLCQDPVETIREVTAPVTLDVPHGKFWLSKSELKTAIFKNQSGLDLEFGYAHRERVLMVRSMKSVPTAQALARMGLRRGDEISQIDGIPSLQLGEWEVDRHLSGVYGDVVSLTWLNQKTRSSTHATFAAGFPRATTAIK